jgi:hypothetical protein
LEHVTVNNGKTRLSPLVYLLWIHGYIDGREASSLGTRTVKVNVGNKCQSKLILERHCGDPMCINPAHLTVAVPQRINPYCHFQDFLIGDLKDMKVTQPIPLEATLLKRSNTI